MCRRVKFSKHELQMLLCCTSHDREEEKEREREREQTERKPKKPATNPVGFASIEECV